MTDPTNLDISESKVTEQDSFAVARHEPGNDVVLLFVHSGREDRRRTWGRLPELIFTDAELSHFDVGLYEYQSPGPAITRIFWPRTPSIAEIGSRFALQLAREFLAGMLYRQVGIIGHGLGGLVGLAAAAHLVELQGDRGAAHIHSLVYFGIAPPRVQGPLTQMALPNFWLRRFRSSHQPADFLFPQALVISSQDAMAASLGAGESAGVFILEKAAGEIGRVKEAEDPAFQVLKSFLLSADQRRRERPSFMQLAHDVEIESNRLTGLLADDQIEVIRILGSPGVGKTSLVSAAVGRLDPALYDVRRLTAPSATDLEHEIAQVGVAAPGGRKPILVVDEADRVSADPEAWGALERIAQQGAFDKVIVVGRETRSMEDAVGGEHHATVRI